MNERHMERCASPEWAEHIRETVIPWALEAVDIGDNLIEVGPGFGATTDILRTKTPHMTAVELDPILAEKLAARMVNTNVEVIHADATDLPFESGQFSAASSFIMLHHVPTPELQDRVLSELARVLRPGGVLFGVDSLDSPAFREAHIGDTCVPLNPLTLKDRLVQAGFTDVEIQVWSIGVRFRARTPLPDAAG